LEEVVLFATRLKKGRVGQEIAVIADIARNRRKSEKQNLAAD
jgi:hypothetical protein